MQQVEDNRRAYATQVNALQSQRDEAQAQANQARQEVPEARENAHIASRGSTRRRKPTGGAASNRPHALLPSGSNASAPALHSGSQRVTSSRSHRASERDALTRPYTKGERPLGGADAQYHSFQAGSGSDSYESDEEFARPPMQGGKRPDTTGFSLEAALQSVKNAASQSASQRPV